MNKIRIMRAEEEWQRAGAYSVRIQGMNRQYHISLREEFDEHDGNESRYIVLIDDEYPVATCRFYELTSHCVMIGRVVVLPEYRNQHLGSMVIREAEKWIAELGYNDYYDFFELAIRFGKMIKGKIMLKHIKDMDGNFVIM